MPWIGRLKLKAQLFCDRETAMGPGKADLLEAIDREGSISAAGRAMGMSYRRTWLLVDTMNRCWAEPLVAATPGGGAGRGAHLTDCGRRVLAAFRTLEAELAAAAQAGALGRLEALMAPSPRPAKPSGPASDLSPADSSEASAASTSGRRRTARR